jgi:hypothetical protein
MALFQGVADKLNTDVMFVVAHSAWESGYGGPHAKELHNLFGLTEAGGNDLRFKTYQEGADMYAAKLKPTKAFGAKTFDDYLEGAKQEGYNSATPGYYETVKKFMNDVKRHYNECVGSNTPRW